MNNFKRRGLIFVTFFGSCLAISLLTASLNTNYWVTAQCKRTTENKERSNGTVNLGLFFYEANLNFGLGDRHFPEKMLGSEGILYRERQFLLYELYIGTIACVVAGIFFGIISAMLAIVNAGSNPVEAICHVPGRNSKCLQSFEKKLQCREKCLKTTTNNFLHDTNFSDISKLAPDPGPGSRDLEKLILNVKSTKLLVLPGLYLWNGIALFSSSAAFITWIVQYYLKMRHNLLIYQFRSEEKIIILENVEKHRQ